MKVQHISRKRRRKGATVLEKASYPSGVMEQVPGVTVTYEQQIDLGNGIDDDDVYTAPITADKDILGFDQSSKNIIDADSDDENEMSNAAPVSTLSGMKNIVPSAKAIV
ncbi:hypothetical protein TNCV_799691 [Trichonephila clavipes]|nr:hypothetical protein TNCV_799691 [Trichonephila clavipes]